MLIFNALIKNLSRLISRNNQQYYTSVTYTNKCIFDSNLNLLKSITVTIHPIKCM